MTAAEFIKACTTLDKGRFETLMATVSVKDECLKCGYLIKKLGKMQCYRCACTPGCIAFTIHPQVQSYLLWKARLITEAEHFGNLGIPGAEVPMD